MKRSEIRTNKTYSNGKGTLREVLYKRDRPLGWRDPLWLQYEIVQGGNARGDYANGRCNATTMAAFAKWAKKEVSKP